MPTPEELRSLADAGGFALFLLTAIAGAIGVYRGWIVPGWIYREKSDDVKRLTMTVARLTGELARERHRRRTDGRD